MAIKSIVKSIFSRYNRFFALCLLCGPDLICSGQQELLSSGAVGFFDQVAKDSLTSITWKHVNQYFNRLTAICDQ